MVSSDFEYDAPTTVATALAALTRGGAEARPLAGGQSLLPLMKLRLAQPPALVDLGRISDLNYIREQGEQIQIGATTTHYQVASSALLQRRCPVLAQAAGLIGDPMVRNRGTIGGSLAHADPGADLPAVMLALDAQLVCTSSTGARTIRAGDFFIDAYTTALHQGELLTEVRVPATPSGSGAAYEKFPHPASRFALTGVAARVTVANGSIQSAAVALTGASTKAVRLTAVER
ncbi:MAG: xanthine dehydrogenase family protein subunit M, partial [Chloroflexota bacterium]